VQRFGDAQKIGFFPKLPKKLRLSALRARMGRFVDFIDGLIGAFGEAPVCIIQFLLFGTDQTARGRWSVNARSTGNHAGIGF
jgi:hypothetical protein